MICECCRNTEDNGTIPTCFGVPRHCAIFSFVLTFSTLLLLTSMTLTVYLTHVGGLHQAIVVLVVTSCTLYLLSFIGIIYSVYFCKPKSVSSRNGENSNEVNQTTRNAARRSSISGPPPDIIGFPRAREHFRITPPPPYEVQMSEMSRILRPGISRTTGPSAREIEIAEEARDLIRRMYEEIARTDLQQGLPPQRNEPSVQQMVQIPNTTVRQQEKMVPELLQPNLIVTTQQTSVKNIAGPGLPPIGIRADQATPSNDSRNSLPSQLDLERLTTYSNRCTAIPPKSQFRKKDSLEVAPKRNISSPPKELQTRPKSKGPTADAMLQDNDAASNTYEEIEALNSISGRGISPGGFRTRQASQPKTEPNSSPAGFHTRQASQPKTEPNSSPAGFHTRQASQPKSEPNSSPAGFHARQASQRKTEPNSTISQHGLERFAMDSEVCFAARKKPSPRMGDVLKTAHKRKLISTPLQTRRKAEAHATLEMFHDNENRNNIYEKIEAMSNIQSTDTSEETSDSVEYYCIDKDLVNSSEENDSSISSIVPEPRPAECRRNFRNPSVKVRRQLSAPSSRRFRQLGPSPEGVLDAIATGLDMTPDQWMMAWKLAQKGVPPVERARILGVRLHDYLYNDDKTSTSM